MYRVYIKANEEGVILEKLVETQAGSVKEKKWARDILLFHSTRGELIFKLHYYIWCVIGYSNESCNYAAHFA